MSDHLSSEVLTNSQLAELLAAEAANKEGNKQRACRRAARKAMLWPHEASDLFDEGRLTELEGVGPYIEKLIEGWISDPPLIPEPPATRRDFLTLSQARLTLEEHPEWRQGLNGDLQMHTTYSDGHGTIAEMVDAALAKDYKYIAITDHSKGLAIAGGIDEEKLAFQRLEINQVNESLAKSGAKLTVLQSTEMNLRPDGAGDMDRDALSSLDLVLGSFHSKLRLKEDQTERYLAALENRNLHILGHPRGRMYDFRLGLSADWGRVFERAAELGKAVEIDSFPNRQDLNVDLLRIAADSGALISIGTDSHHPSQLGFIEFGLAAAAQAGIRKERVLNFMPKDRLLEWAHNLRTVGTSVV